MTYQYILTEKRDGTFILTLNRPEKRNALNSAMWAEIATAIEEFDADDESRALWTEELERRPDCPPCLEGVTSPLAADMAALEARVERARSRAPAVFTSG